MALDVEDIIDGGVGREKSLSRSVALEGAASCAPFDGSADANSRLDGVVTPTVADVSFVGNTKGHNG
jgi:hypothetical protein